MNTPKIKNTLHWISFLIRLPFMEAYCHLRYGKTYLQHNNDEIEKMLNQLEERLGS